MPNRYPAEQRERATPVALDRLDEYGSAWAVAQAFGPKLGVGPETLRKWVVQAQTDAGARPGPSSEELAEITRLKKENADLREAHHAAVLDPVGRLLATREFQAEPAGYLELLRWVQSFVT